jgi:hypothetical protein
MTSLLAMVGIESTPGAGVRSGKSLQSGHANAFLWQVLTVSVPTGQQQCNTSE